MAYSDPSYLSGRETLGKKNKKIKSLFKLKSGDAETSIYPESILPWVTAQRRPVKYTKKVRKVSQKSLNSIDIIRKDGEFDSFIWHTSADKLKEATRWGIVKTQSVTGKVISALGQYRLIVLDRIQTGRISNRHVLKDKLLSLYQDRFEALEKLESIANRTHTREEIEKMMNEYIATLEKTSKGLDNYFLNTNFDDVDCHGIKHLQAEIVFDIKRARHFLKYYQPKIAQRSTGVDSILTFAKKQMIRNLREMQNHNQNITYSRKMFFAATRGDLNSVIEDAQKVIEDYNAPPRDSIGAEHHGLYGAGGDRVAYDSEFHCASSREEQRTLTAITFIEGMNTLNLSNPKKPTVDNILNQSYPLKVIRATKWEMGGDFSVAMKRMLAWCANVVIKVIAGVVELLLTLLVEPLFFGFCKSFFNFFRQLATLEIKVKDPRAPVLVGQKLINSAKRPRQSLGMRIRHFAKNAFRNTGEDLIYGVRDVYKQFAVHLFDCISDDFADGAKVKPDLATVYKLGDEEIAKINAAEDATLLSLSQSFLNAKQEEVVATNEQFATPNYLPSAGEFSDALNATAEGAEQFLAFFTHNIHAKHPFAGLLFTLVYTAGGLAVLAPQSVAFLGKGFLAYSQAIGYSMSKSPVTAAISSAVTQAQLASCAHELLIHGPESWLATSAANFEKEPFTSLIYAATALGFGYLVVYQLNIPWLSDILKEDMGSFSPTSLAFVGVKLGVLVYELLSEETRAAHEQSEKLNALEAYLTELYKKTHPNVSETDVQKYIAACIDKLLRAENAEALLAGYKKIQSNSQFNDLSVDDKNKMNLHIKRTRMIQYLKTHQDKLPYLSPKAKHLFAQQIDELFPFAEARSLRKVFNPEEKTSIFRTTLHIIFAYPALILRVFIAIVSSIVQLSIKPLKSACIDLGLKILKDLTRIGRAIAKVCKLIASFFLRQIKTVADVFVNSVLARGQALTANRHHIANAGYKVSADVDVAYESARQFLSTPGDAATKVVTSAHPVDTENKVEISYLKMLMRMGGPGLKVVEELRPSSLAPLPTQRTRGEKGVISGELNVSALVPSFSMT